MTTPTTPPPDDAAPDAGRQGSTIGRIAAVVIVLGIALMWIYVLTARPDVPGRLKDAAYAPAAQQICAEAKDEIARLPKAFQTPDPAERARVVDQATEVLDRMVGRLEGITPTAEPDRGLVTTWIADWRTYLDDRRAYADQLPGNPELRFYVTQRREDNKQVTEAMDRFAEPPVNNMPACTIPDDLG